jgi:hypothetical protein
MAAALGRLHGQTGDAASDCHCGGQAGLRAVDRAGPIRARIGDRAMRVHDLCSRGIDILLLVVASVLVFFPEARSPGLKRLLAVLCVVTFVDVVVRLREANALGTPIRSVRGIPRRARPTALRALSGLMALAATMATT